MQFIHVNLPVCVLVVQLCLTLFDPMNYSLPGSSVHGILQARVLEWVAIPFFKGSSQPKDRPGSSALQMNSLLPKPTGKPKFICIYICFITNLSIFFQFPLKILWVLVSIALNLYISLGGNDISTILSFLNQEHS